MNLNVASVYFSVFLFHFFWMGLIVGLISSAAATFGGKFSAQNRCRIQWAILVLMIACVPVAVVVASQQQGQVSVVKFAEPLQAVYEKSKLASTPGKEASSTNSLDDIAPKIRDVNLTLDFGLKHSGEDTHRNLEIQFVESGLDRSPNRQRESQNLFAWIIVLAPWITMAYVSGLAVMFARLILVVIGCRRMIGSAKVVKDTRLSTLVRHKVKQFKMRFTPMIAESVRVSTPVVVGITKPMILFPSSLLSGLSMGEIEAILAHELAHIRRFDHMLILIQRITESLFFFHPTTWMISRRITEDRELCCDDFVISSGTDVVDYATSLVKVAELAFKSKKKILSVAAAGESPDHLISRVRRMLGETPSTPQFAFSRTCIAAWFATVLIACAVCVAAIQNEVPQEKDVALRSQSKDKIVLNFPEDRCVGTLFVRPKGTATTHRSWFPSLNYTRKDLPECAWNKFGNAQGKVEIAADQEIQFQLNAASVSDLSFLQDLDPNTLNMLAIQDLPIENEAMQQVARLSGLRSLFLSNTNVTSEGIKHLAILKGLKSLTVCSQKSIGKLIAIDDQAMKTIAGFKNLKRLVISHSLVTDEGMKELKGHPCLARLAIQETSITDAGIRQLQGLDLREFFVGGWSGSPGITDESAKIIGQMKNLERLDVSATKIGNDGLSSFVNLQKLESLCLDSLEITNESMKHIGKLKSLEWFRCFSLQFDETGMTFLSQCKNLKQLLGRIQGNDKTVDQIAKFKRIEEIRLSGNGIDSDLLRRIADLKNLRYLGLANCNMDDNDLEIIKNLPLESLAIRNTKVLGFGFSHFADAPVKLLEFDFAPKKLASPSDGGCIVEMNGIGKLKSLETLIFNAGKAEVQNFESLIDCKQLKTFYPFEFPLNDEHCHTLGKIDSLQSLVCTRSEMTDDGIKSLSKLPNLNHLIIGGEFTDACVRDLAKIKTLGFFHLYSRGVTIEARNWLTSQLPNLSRGSVSDNQFIPMHSLVTTDKIRRYGTRGMRSFNNSLEGKPAPNFQIKHWINSPDHELKLKDLKGKVVLLDFWGTWCKPCIEAMPKLKALQKKHGDDLVIISIHTTKNGDRAVEFFESNDYDWTFAVDDDNKTANALQPMAFPSYTIVDRKGILRMSDLYHEDLENAIEFVIAGKFKE